MPEFDPDEHIRKMRKKENLFGTIKDSKTGYYVSFPLVDSNKKSITLPIEVKPKTKSKKKKAEVIKPKKKIVERMPEKEELPKVWIDYEKESYQNLNICFWKMNLAYGMDWDIPWNLQKWADNKIELKENAKIWLTRANEDEIPPELYLIIAGKGHDNRCTWCKSFWTAFENNSDDRNFSIDKTKTCIFDT